MAEVEGTHRRETDDRRLSADIEFMRAQNREVARGQWLAFAIAALFFGAATYVTTCGYPWAGGGLGAIGIGSIVSAFIWGRTPRGPKPEQEAVPGGKKPSGVKA